ncbi:MAG: hypothetical protein DIZ80_09300 [endosymbiont of Galathealinum brachiosum]|uniref:Uncharacterized protein n=1 Tax=endosymbiont of Galathealinum brachiosum TaxID=2200906 RepID=A0A370DE85_9GAMM|nr:MAG: hypothetical protein DIZ80_09300 [endosymbiont of Galathealinum brachiosum]
MSIGTSIFLSVIFMSIFYIITIYNKWKLIGKAFGGLIALSIIGGASYWVYLEYAARPQVLNSLRGIDLGITEVELTLAKGKPDYYYNAEEKYDHRKYLIYDEISITLNTNIAGVLEVDTICNRGNYTKVQGLSKGDPESKIIEKLGVPSNTSINKEGLIKLTSYPKWNTNFEIEKGVIKKICVTRTGVASYTKEYSDTKDPKDK